MKQRQMTKIEQATMRLLAAIPLSEMDRVFAEVDRREEVFRRHQHESDAARPHPRVSALASVCDDCVQGRFV